MARFEVQGRHQQTGRKRTRVYAVPDESQARSAAEAEGMVVERVSRLPGVPPTEPQLSYANSLGIAVPQDATIEEVSELISSHLHRDKTATERHRSFAARYGVEFTRFTGKRELFARIQATVRKPGRELDLVSWFTYRVYRELVHGRDDAEIDGPDHPTIRQIAVELVRNDSVVKSIRRYEGRDLIWFGEWTSSLGALHTGGSNRTIGYKRASAMLREQLGLTAADGSTRRAKAEGQRPAIAGQPEPTSKRGCFPLLVLCLGAIGLLWGIASWAIKLVA